MENTPEKLISESDLLKVLGLKKSELDRIRREKGLPYVRISQRARAYFLSDVVEWARKNRMSPEMR